jgi:hypothetical protein
MKDGKGGQEPRRSGWQSTMAGAGGGQDFEQSQSNHGWPRVALEHGLGSRCGSLVRSNIRTKSGPSSRNFHDTTTRVVGASRSIRRHDYSRSLIAYERPDRSFSSSQMPMDRPITPTRCIWCFWYF